MSKNKKIVVVFVFIVIAMFSALFLIFHSNFDRAMVVSVSSDGRYVLTSNLDKTIVLWNIKKHTRKLISSNGNIYSAYFIKNSNNFLWQDLNNIVHVDNIYGKKIMAFKNFPTYGQVMTSDLKHYIASDKYWNLFSGIGKEQKRFKETIDSFGGNKLFNLTLSDDNKTLLSAGECITPYDEVPLSKGATADEATKNGYYKDEPGQIYNNYSLLSGIVSWDVNTGKPLKKFPELMAKAYATLSPDGKYVVGGDEDSDAFVWETKTGNQKFELYDLVHGKCTRTEKGGKDWKCDNTGLIERAYYTNIDAVLSIKFIDLEGDYLRFTTYIPYAILFNVNDPKPKKYFYLGHLPFPSVDLYSRNASIDTSPKAHILVVGKRSFGGIMVYKFDPKNKTLKKIWNAN